MAELMPRNTNAKLSTAKGVSEFNCCHRPSATTGPRPAPCTHFTGSVILSWEWTRPDFRFCSLTTVNLSEPTTRCYCRHVPVECPPLPYSSSRFCSSSSSKLSLKSSSSGHFTAADICPQRRRESSPKPRLCLSLVPCLSETKNTSQLCLNRSQNNNSNNNKPSVDGSGTIKFKSAACWRFKNAQNSVNKVNTKAW